MTKSPTSPIGGLSLDGIEVVELSDVDVDFEMLHDGAAAPTLETTTTEPAKPEDLAKLELFTGLSSEELSAVAGGCQSIHAVPGYVLLAPGRLNSSVFFVLEGQLRLYPRTGDKRPIAVADVGQSTGLRSALGAQPVNHAVIATEISHIVAVDRAALDEGAKRLHALARNYSTLLASYLRGDNCLHVGAHSPGATARPGYVDELTLLHNEHWLNTRFPRLLARARLGDKPLAVAAFAVDRLDEIAKAHGAGAGLRVLQTIGHWTLDQTRPTDLVAINKNRYILAFLPDCDLTAARQLASRLKTQIQSLSISLASPKAIAPIKVTLSLGVTELEKGMKDNEFLNKAENLIQKSVKLGGDQVSEAL